MKKTKLSLLSVVLCMSSVLSAQTSSVVPQATETPATQTSSPAPVVVAPAPAAATAHKLTWGGFVKTEFFTNSRASAELREGIVNMQPFDKMGHNVPLNATTASDATKSPYDVAQFRATSIFSRLNVKLTDLKAFGAKATGFLEGDFMGVSSTFNTTMGAAFSAGTEDLFRIRHAYGELDWTDASNKGFKLLAGQYWNPMFLANCFPTVSSTTTGIPFHPFGWVPQLKLSYHVNGLSLIGLAYTERSLNRMQIGQDNNGRSNTNLPVLHFQVQYLKALKNGIKVDVGGGVDWNSIRPQISVANVFANSGNTDSLNTNTLNAVTYMAYLNISKKDLFTFKYYYNRGAAFNQFVGLGGYAQYKDNTKTGVNALKLNYVNQITIVNWVELIIEKHPVIKPAIWIGYMMNDGLETTLNSTNHTEIAFQGRGIGSNRTFDDYIRIAPRVDFVSGKMKFALEYSYDRITFGNTDVTTFKIKSADAFRYDAVNHRLNLVAQYNF